MEKYSKITDLLLKKTYTKGDLYYRIELLKEFFEHSFFASKESVEISNSHLSTFLEERGEDKHLVDFFSTFPEDFFKTFSAKNMHSLLSTAKKEVELIPSFVLYVPASLPYEEVRKIGIWVRENLKGFEIVSLKVDKQALGGCTFVWKNIHYDFSLTHYIKKHKKEIRSRINTFYETIESN